MPIQENQENSKMTIFWWAIFHYPWMLSQHWNGNQNVHRNWAPLTLLGGFLVRLRDIHRSWRPTTKWKDRRIGKYDVILLMEEILHQLIGSWSHYLQGFVHPRWCRISSINSIYKDIHHYVDLTFVGKYDQKNIIYKEMAVDNWEIQTSSSFFKSFLGGWEMDVRWTGRLSSSGDELGKTWVHTLLSTSRVS